MKTCIALLLLAAGPVSAQSFCGPASEGQVTAVGCTCRHQAAGLLTNTTAGWRWTCDLLRQGAGPAVPADLPGGPSHELPTGFVYAPQSQSSQPSQSQSSQAFRPGY